MVCAKVMNYMGNTPETVANKTYLVSLNGKTAGGTTPDTPIAGEAKGDGTATNPFNSVAAQKYTAALEAGVITDKEFYIKGKVQSIKNQFSADFGNGSFYIADDANSTQFYIFRIYYFGGEKWKKGDMTLKEGDEIVVCAKLINYMGNTPETNQGGKLISVMVRPAVRAVELLLLTLNQALHREMWRPEPMVDSRLGLRESQHTGIPLQQVTQT